MAWLRQEVIMSPKKRSWVDLRKCDYHRTVLVALLEGCAHLVLAALQIEPMEGTPLS